MTEHNIKDVELTVPAAGIGHVHIKTREKPRLTDGIRHLVKTRKATEKELTKSKGD